MGNRLLGLMLAGMLAGACSGDGIKEGNQLVCTDGDDCESSCDAAEETCDVECKSGSTCKATCKSGKDCDFVCHSGAKCTFDCTGQSCQVAGSGTDCSCSGSCTGTCGGSSSATDGTDSTDGTGGDADCVSKCGAPTDPGYAECVGKCS